MTKRYDTYKDSGVQWLGEIPGHWNCTSLGRMLSEKLQYGASESGDLECTNDSMRYIRITDITLDGKLKSDGCKFLPSEIGKNYPVRKGDVLLARSGATVGKAFIYNEEKEACYAGYLIKASVQQDKVSPQFFFYYTQSSQYNEWKNRIFIQATIQNISAEKYARMSLCVPPLSEQHSIVSYLDDKCGKIDKMLEGKQKQIELLAEMKQRIIADAVTRGLNPNVKMKATDNICLGSIPNHWKVMRYGTLFKLKPVKKHHGEELLSVFLNFGVIRAVESDKRTHAASEDLSKYQLVEPTDFVMNNQQAWRGSVGVSKLTGIISPAYHLFLMPSCLVPDYANALLRSKAIVGQFEMSSRGVGSIQRTLNFNWLNNKLVPVPPLPEQQAIVSYITEKTTKIDTLAAKLQQEIESIKEYKQRLISDVVTGQIKVC